MKEILPNMFDNIRNEMIILVIIFVAAIVIWFIGNQIDIVNGVYEAIRETINNEDHPNPNDLQELTTFRRFRKTQPEFQQAVHEKLKAYDIIPTAIEKTMSPAQLYKANNPLYYISSWRLMVNVNANTLLNFSMSGRKSMVCSGGNRKRFHK